MAQPTTRVLAVLEMLQSHGRMSGPELARRVGVDVRTLRRYIVMLEDLGIPLTAERGRHGAYMLVAGFKLPPMMFSNDEAVALSVGMVAARGLGLAEAAPAAESVQAKLARVMPDSLKRQVRAIAGTVKVDLLPAASTPDSNAALIALTGAAQAERRVSMSYESAEGVRTEREFDPYGLAYRAGAWYAVGMCHLRHGLRTFRLDRIGKVSLLDRPFRRPSGFDPLDQLVRGIAAIPHAQRSKFYCPRTCGGRVVRFRSRSVCWSPRKAVCCCAPAPTTWPGSRVSSPACRSTSKHARRRSCASNSGSAQRGCKHWPGVDGEAAAGHRST